MTAIEEVIQMGETVHLCLKVSIRVTLCVNNVLNMAKVHSRKVNFLI